MRMKLFFMTLLLLPAMAVAQEYDSGLIRCQLDPSCPKPGLRGLPFGKRGISVTGDAKQPENSVNFHINFEFDSAVLQNDALITLDALGKALTDKSLDGFRFMIAGYTDAKGTPDYNQKLSERRAAAVADYLSQHFGVASDRLITKGFGMDDLFDASHPYDEVNRRVLVSNLDVVAAQ